MDAIEHNEELPDQGEDIPPLPDPIDVIDKETIDFIRSSKLSEMSYACRQAIESGIDLQIQGENRHFSLTTQD